MTDAKNAENGWSAEGKLADLSGMGIDLEGAQRLSKRFCGYFPAAGLVELAAEAPPEGRAEVDLTASLEEKLSGVLRNTVGPAATVLRLRGWVRCPVQQTCARCLSLFSMRVEVAVDRLFVPGPDPAEAGSQQEMVEELTYLPDYRLDVGHAVEEELLLALPMVSLCQPECAGLCSECGADLNHEVCVCVGKQLEGPFAMLSNWKVR